MPVSHYSKKVGAKKLGISMQAALCNKKLSVVQWYLGKLPSSPGNFLVILKRFLFVCCSYGLVRSEAFCTGYLTSCEYFTSPWWEL